MRASFTALVVVVVTVVVGGCSQTTSPTSPSSIAAGTSATAQHGPPITPVLAQLNLVDNHIISANHQLTMYLIPGNPVIPPNPVFPQNALNFYIKANGVLDTVAIPGNPLTPQWNAALSAIIGDANITLDLLFACDGCIPGNPLFPVITDQANHTIAVATSLMSTF